MTKGQDCPAYHSCFFASAWRETEHVTAQFLRTADDESQYMLTIGGKPTSLRSFLEESGPYYADRLQRSETTIPTAALRCGSCALTDVECDITLDRTFKRER